MRRHPKNVYAVSIVTRIMMVGIGFLYSILLARYLGSELRGQLSYINTITAITVIVFSFGMHQAYPYYRKQQVPNIKRTYTHICLIVFVLYLSLALLLSFLFRIWGVDQRVMIAGLLTPLLTFSKLITYQVMIEDPNRKNAWEIVCEVAEVVALLALLFFFERSLKYALYVIVGKNIMACVYYLQYVRADLRIHKDDFVMLRKFAAFGFLPMISLLMNNLNYRVDILMLGRSVSDQDIGIYAIGIQFAEKVWMISEAMRDVLFSKLIKGKDAEEVNKVIRICITISAMVDFCIIILGKPFISICYGAEYIDAYQPMVIVLFGTLVMVFYKIIQAYNVVHKKQNKNFAFLAVSVVANVVMNTLLIPVLGVNGAAVASLISYTVCAMLFLTEYMHATGSRLRDIILLKKADITLVLRAFKPTS